MIRNKGKRSVDRGHKAPLIVDFRECKSSPQNDIYYETLCKNLEIIIANNKSKNSCFPIKIEAERSESDIEPEAMLYLISNLHGCEKKNVLVNELKQK